MTAPLRATVLVTDGAQRASLATVRSLGKAGCTVHVVSSSGKSLAGASRYATAEHAVTDPLQSDSAFADELQRIASRIDADLIIPIAEPSVLALLPRREMFGRARIPFVNAETFARIADKAQVLAAAADVGIAVPAQHVVADAAAARTLDLDVLEYPVVVKPARSVAGTARSRIKVSVEHAADPASLRRVLDAMDARAYPLLLQQRVVGPGIGVFLLLWDDQTVAAFAHRRLREKPPSGGVSVYRESAPLDAELLDRSRALLEHFDWQGVAMIEFKIDEATGTPYLMEINGRFWGSLQLAIDAGVDFPALLVRTALGQRPAPVTSYRLGVQSRWFWGDVDHLLAMLRRTPEELALPHGAPGRAATLRAFLTPRAGDREEILRFSDPRPFLRESAQWLRDLRH